MSQTVSPYDMDGIIWSQRSREVNQTLRSLQLWEMASLPSWVGRVGASGTREARSPRQPLTSLLPLTAPDRLLDGRTSMRGRPRLPAKQKFCLTSVLSALRARCNSLSSREHPSLSCPSGVSYNHPLPGYPFPPRCPPNANKDGFRGPQPAPQQKVMGGQGSGCSWVAVWPSLCTFCPQASVSNMGKRVWG